MLAPMTGDAPAPGYRVRNSTADRALTVLEMFDEERLTVSAVEVASTLGVARSTAYRYLESLVSRGFLEESSGGGFRLGLRILELSRLARHGFGLSEIALPRMKALSRLVEQTVVLTRRVGTTVICLEREADLGRLVRISYERGSQLPLTAGASALVLLAWLPDDEARELLRAADRPQLTDRTLRDVDALVERLHQIRADGHSVSVGELDVNAVGIAAPVFGPDGDVVAGLSIVAVAPVDAAARAAMVDAVRAAAAEISSVLAVAAG